MIRTFLQFDLVEGGADALVELFRRHRVLETSVAQDGCISAELTLDEAGRTATVTAAWSDGAAYDRWTSRSDRGELADELNQVLATPIGEATVGEIYDVAWTAAGSPA
jgi:quinol monooxygenase YgiN